MVGADGALGDIVVDDVAIGEALCDRVEGLTKSDWEDRDTTAALTIGPAHRRRMAGLRVR